MENNSTIVNTAKSVLEEAFKKAAIILGGSMAGMGDAMGSQSSKTEDAGIHKHSESKSVFDALLRGEVTKEVEELRYRTYLIDREAEIHRQASMLKVSPDSMKRNYFIDGKIHFKHENAEIKKGITESLNSYNNGKIDSNVEHTLKFSYSNMGKYNLENYCTEIEIDIDEKAGKRIIRLKVPKGNEWVPVKYRQIENDIRRTINDQRYGSLLFDGIRNIQFTTSTCSGEVANMNYNIVTPTFVRTEDDGESYGLVFRCHEIHREDIVEKYKSDSMAKKYETKERKELTLNDTRESFRCMMCQCEVNKDSMELSVQDTGYVLCPHCLLEVRKTRNELIDEQK